MHVLHPLRVVLLLQLPELLGLGQELLVEVQKRAFEEAILLVLGQIQSCFVLQFLLLEDVSAVILLLIQDLDGQVSIVVQLLQQPSDLVPIEMGIFPQDDLEVGFELTLVCSEGTLLVGEHVVLADLVVAGEQGF